MSIQVELQSKIDMRKQRWNEFLKPGAEPGFLFQAYYQDNGLPPAPPIWPDKASERIEYKWLAYQSALARASEVDDDWVPYLNMSTGTEIFVEAFGCAVHRPVDNMPFAIARIRSASQVAGVQVPAVEEYIGDALNFFADTCAQQHCAPTPDLPTERWQEVYPRNSRVVIEPWADDKASAGRIASELQRLRA